MASPVYYKLGVALPLKNTYFRYGKEFGMDLNAAIAVDATDPVIKYATPLTTYEYLEVLMGVGDKLILGPSNDDDNENATEEITLASVGTTSDTGDNNVTTSGGLTFDYSEDDKVTGVSTYVPEGWHVQPSAYDTTHGSNSVTMYRLRSFPEDNFGASITQVDRGVSGEECLKIKFDYGYTGQTAPTFEEGIWQDISSADFVENTTYNWGFFYKARFISSSDTTDPYITCTMLDVDSDYTSIYHATDYIALRTVAKESAGDVNYWTEFSIANDVTTLSNDSLRLGLGIHSINDVCTIMMFAQCPYIEHAKGTSDASSGVYTFTELPVLGSPMFTKKEFETDVELLDGSIKTYNPTGRKSPRWSFQCNFENADVSFFEDLKILMAHQRSGKRLNFHTREAIGENPSGLPPIMIGKMYIDRVRQNLWDVNKVSFIFKFNETE